MLGLESIEDLCAHATIMNAFPGIYIKLILSLLLATVLAFRYSPEWINHSVKYQIKPDSKLEILGSSNINLCKKTLVFPEERFVRPY